MNSARFRGMPAVLTVAALLLIASSLPVMRLTAGDAAAKSTKKKTTLSVSGPGTAWDPANPDPDGVGAALGVAPWLEIINQAAADAHAPWQVLAAIMAIESGGNPGALSPAGAVGLMQLMPADWGALSHAYGDDIWTPWTNVRTAADILARAHARWGTWDRAAAAYFGALDARGDITDARDAYGTSGQQYVERFRVTLAALGMGQSLDGLGDAGEAPASDAIAAGLGLALQQQGVPYLWGGNAPELGFDCSGLVWWAYAQVGLPLPRTAAEQWHWTERVDAADALPGDLVFFAGTDGPGISHVGIYAGAGLMLDAPNVGQTVTLEALSDPYWQAHLAGFGRVDPNYTPTDPMLPVATDPAPAEPATDPGQTPVAAPAPLTPTETPVESPAETPSPASNEPQPTAPSATPEPGTPTPDATSTPDDTPTPAGTATPETATPATGAPPADAAPSETAPVENATPEATTT